MEQFKFKPQTKSEGNKIKELLNLARINKVPIIIISLTVFAASIIYAMVAQNIYNAKTALRISKPQTNIIQGPLVQDISEYTGNLVANQIETLKSGTIREKVIDELIDSFKVAKNKDKFYLILNKDSFGKLEYSLKPYSLIMETLGQKVYISQKRNLDVIEIDVESPSPYEAALIANLYAKAYTEFNLAENRQNFTSVRTILEKQLSEKQTELQLAEDNKKNYQYAGGTLDLDAQTRSLLSQLQSLEGERNTVYINMLQVKETWIQYKNELARKDPSLSSYLENKASEPYLLSMQEQIAKLEAQRDFALLNNRELNNNSPAIKDYNSKIGELKNRLAKSIEEYQKGIAAASPDEIKSLTQKIFEEEVRYKSLLASYNQLNEVIKSNEAKIDKLPAKTVDLARLERERSSVEQLYTALQQKYQEALINEQSTAGNVFIVAVAEPPLLPSKPNRKMIIAMGLFLGLGLGFGFVYVRNMFDRTVKTPEDIEQRDVRILGWIPKIKFEDKNGQKDSELIAIKQANSIPGEAFRTLRSRLQLLDLKKDVKTILITSSAPKEGKTLLSSNIAASFALANKKTIIIDCDLRIPRLHVVFNEKRTPGLTDYFTRKTSLEEIIKKSENPYLDFITGGTLPPDPAEVIGSPQMKNFIQKLRTDYDIVIVDSPPILAVADAEILSRLVDFSILVVTAETTEIESMQRSVELMKSPQGSFIGVILNNFDHKRSDKPYYKYSHYYYGESKTS